MAAAFRRPDDGEGVIVTERTLKIIASLVSLFVLVGGLALSIGAANVRLKDAVTHSEYDVDMIRMKQDREIGLRALNDRIVLDSLRHEADRAAIVEQREALQTLTARVTQFICDQGSRRPYCR